MEPKRRHNGRVNRRRFLMAGAGLAVVGVSPAEARAAMSEDPGLCGRVVEVMPDGLRIARIDTGESLRVEGAPGVVVLRDGRGQVTDFLPGEKVVVHGERRSDGVFVATAIDVIYDLAESASVISRNGDVLSTDAGDVVLDALTAPRSYVGGAMDVVAEPVSTIGPGDAINVLARWDPDSGRLLARSIGVWTDGAR